MKKLISFVLCFLPLFSNAQSADSIIQHYTPTFTEHLFKSKLYNDVYRYLNLFEKNKSTGNSIEICYARERLLFEKKAFNLSQLNWMSSCDTFNPLNNSVYFNKWIYYKKLNQLHQAFNYASEDISLYYKLNSNAELLWTDTIQSALNSILQLTKDLMLHDTILFESQLKHYTNLYPHKNTDAIENLNLAKNELQQIKNYKAWKAGALSAIIPGAGKMYSGNVWQGVSVLIAMSVIGLQAYEGFHKKGINSIHGWAYTGLFSIFYVGNIWGSVVGIKVKQRKAYENIHRNLLDNADKLVEQF